MRCHIDFISLKGSFHSKNLGRNVRFRLVAPGDYWASQKNFPVLMMNDGQDYATLKLEQTLISTFSSKSITPFIYVGMESNEARINEYGTASTQDFKGRGGKALQYSQFIIEEFIPFLKESYKVSEQCEEWVYCGMSLGGLSAFDIAYNHPKYFGKIGVFSGSFWWRKRAYVKKDLKDRSRIILDVIKNRERAPHLKFWFQCGTQDEAADRNNNGIIDSIDDTQDVIKELQEKGYAYPGDITYLEIDGGKHDLPTWGHVFPRLIKWAFARK